MNEMKYHDSDQNLSIIIKLPQLFSRFLKFQFKFYVIEVFLIIIVIKGIIKPFHLLYLRPLHRFYKNMYSVIIIRTFILKTYPAQKLKMTIPLISLLLELKNVYDVLTTKRRGPLNHEDSKSDHDS